MKNIRLYQNTPLKINSELTLDGYASHHLIKVLRFPEWQNITLFNGDGMDYIAKVHDTKKNCIVQVLSKEKNLSESKLNLTLAQGIVKGEKMDFLIQKSVELGVNKITDLRTEEEISFVPTRDLGVEYKNVELRDGQSPRISQIENFPEEVKMPGYHPWTDVDITNIERAIDLLLSSEKPIILAGGGTIISSAFAELQSIAEMLMIPVVTTFKGKGSFPENHPLSLGPIGMHGHAEANKIMTEVDCVLAIGTRFSDRSVGTFEEFERNLKIIHMDVDPAEIGKNQTTQVAIVGDVKASLRVMLKMLVKKAFKKSEDNKWLKHVNEVKDYWRENLKLHPGEMSAAKILRKLREVLPKESIVTTEVGQHQMWASLFFDVIHPGTFFSSTGLGTMGWGFPASIGAKVARPDVPVLDIAGEGSFNMTENSLATSVLDNIPVIVFLVNNFSLGMVAQWQRTFYEKRMIGIDLKNCPDYVKLAESYGAQGIRAQSLDELEKAIKTGLSSDVTTVIDIPIDPEEDVLPFVAPGTSLKEMILPS